MLKNVNWQVVMTISSYFYSRIIPQINFEEFFYSSRIIFEGFLSIFTALQVFPWNLIAKFCQFWWKKILPHFKNFDLLKYNQFWTKTEENKENKEHFVIKLPNKSAN